MHCKLASTAEIIKAYRQVHAVWPHDADPEVHLQLRLQSVQHQRASWFVLVEGDEIISSLGAYPVDLFGVEELRPARAFGAVFTSPLRRCQGHAAELIRWTRAYYAEKGTNDFLLYSDIGADYYAKLGFKALPSFEFHWELGSAQHHHRLRSANCAPQALGRSNFTFGLSRSAEDAVWLLAKQKTPLHLSQVLDAENQWTGEWLLATVDAESYQLLETNLPQTADAWSYFSALLEADARRLACTKVQGWWTSPEACPHPVKQVDVRRREREILMWASAAGEGDPWWPKIDTTGFRVFASEHV